jgi:DNA polymerase-3 subunit alpha
MEHADFVHLHVHTDYSLLDGACQIGPLVELARSYRLPALAITDHGNMFGAVEFYKKARDAGIKPIIGSEVYVAIGDRRERTAVEGITHGSFHLVLLVKDDEGYHNLIKLSTTGYLDGFYYRPRIDKEYLAEHAKGLICMSACTSGEISHYILAGDMERAQEAAAFYRDLFEPGDFYLELMNIGFEENLVVNDGLAQIAQDLDLPLVCTNDCHYLHQEDAEAHDILLCLQTSKDLDDPNRLRFATNELYFKSPDEMKALFPEHPEALANTIEIAEKCNLALDLDSSRVHLPHYPIPKGFHNADDYLEHLAHEGLHQRYARISKDAEERFAFELKAITEMGMSSYFLIINDLVATARTRGIRVGPGRGSAVGSLVLYALGVTSIDPLQYGLLFERFLNPERISMPDIDIDFADDRRDEMIQYAIERYGEKSVSQIITFGTMAARAAVRDVARVLKIPYSEADRIAKLIPFGTNITIKQALRQVPKLKSLVESNERYQKMIEIACRLEGSSRHASTHAAGVVIAPGDLTTYVPLFKSPEGTVSTQYTMKALEDIGLLKVDFLGLRTLTVIEETLALLHQRGVELDLENISLEDPEVYGLLSRAETVGIFQLESTGMRDMLRKLCPENMEDLIAVLSLYRPGPLGGVSKDDFAQRRHGKETITYLHKSLEPILKDTYGIILYQEQVMQIAHTIGGFSLGEADILRRAMGKKIQGVMDEKRKAFVEGAQKHKVSDAVANKIFDLMVPFAGYGFNKSHSTGYALISYQTAYLKVHYPVEFMAATLSSEMSNTDRIALLINECRRMGITVALPDVNRGQYRFVPGEHEILYGLGAVKNVGKAPVDALVDAREREGPFRSVEDLIVRVSSRSLNKRALESLIKAGAMDSLGRMRAQLLGEIETAYRRGRSTRAKRNRGQISLFEDNMLDTEASPEAAREAEELSTSDLLSYEKEALGFYFSSHPLEHYRDEMDAFATPLSDLPQLADGARVSVGGIVVTKKETKDRKGRAMAFFTIEDLGGRNEVLVFSDLYDSTREQIQKDAAVFIRGRISRRENEESKVLAEEIIPMESARAALTRAVYISMETDGLEDSMLERVRSSLAAFPGPHPVFFHLMGPHAERTILRSNSLRVTPEPELIDELRSLAGVTAVGLRGE